MQIGELAIGQCLQLDRRVQLHGAGAKWDHGAVQRDIAPRETTHIAHHLGLRVIALEYRVGQDRGPALQRRRNTLWQARVQRLEIDLIVGVAREYAP